eukprot:gene15876-biopygen8404
MHLIPAREDGVTCTISFRLLAIFWPMTAYHCFELRSVPITCDIASLLVSHRDDGTLVQGKEGQQRQEGQPGPERQPRQEEEKPEGQPRQEAKQGFNGKPGQEETPEGQSRQEAKPRFHGKPRQEEKSEGQSGQEGKKQSRDSMGSRGKKKRRKDSRGRKPSCDSTGSRGKKKRRKGSRGRKESRDSKESRGKKKRRKRSLGRKQSRDSKDSRGKKQSRGRDRNRDRDRRKDRDRDRGDRDDKGSPTLSRDRPRERVAEKEQPENTDLEAVMGLQAENPFKNMEGIAAQKIIEEQVSQKQNAPDPFGKSVPKSAPAPDAKDGGDPFSQCAVGAPAPARRTGRIAGATAHNSVQPVASGGPSCSQRWFGVACIPARFGRAFYDPGKLLAFR